MSSVDMKIYTTWDIINNLKEWCKRLVKQSHVGPLSPQQGASSGCGWRIRPPDMEGGCGYTE
jgi:hypothetical protein